MATPAKDEGAVADFCDDIRRRRRALADSLNKESFPHLWDDDGSRIDRQYVRAVVSSLLSQFCTSVPSIQAMNPFWHDEHDHMVGRVFHLLVRAGVIVLTGDQDEATTVNMDALAPLWVPHKKFEDDRKRRSEHKAMLRRNRLNRWRPPAEELKIPRGWVAHAISSGESALALAGTYVIYGDGRLVYIGSSVAVSARLAGHGLRTGKMSTPWGEFTTLVVKVKYSRKYGDWLMREMRLISRLQPPGNTAGKRRVRRAKKKV